MISNRSVLFDYIHVELFCFPLSGYIVRIKAYPSGVGNVTMATMEAITVNAWITFVTWRHDIYK